MSIQVTNRKASQALRGQSVLVTLNSTDAAQLVNFSEGILCTNDGSGKIGTINRVDYFGNSFSVSPIQPNTDFSSVSPYGYLASGATVTVTT